MNISVCVDLRLIFVYEMIFFSIFFVNLTKIDNFPNWFVMKYNLFPRISCWVQATTRRVKMTSQIFQYGKVKWNANTKYNDTPCVAFHCVRRWYFVDEIEENIISNFQPIFFRWILNGFFSVFKNVSSWFVIKCNFFQLLNACRVMNDDITPIVLNVVRAFYWIIWQE